MLTFWLFGIIFRIIRHAQTVFCGKLELFRNNPLIYFFEFIEIFGRINTGGTPNGSQ